MCREGLAFWPCRGALFLRIHTLSPDPSPVGRERGTDENSIALRIRRGILESYRPRWFTEFDATGPTGLSVLNRATSNTGDPRTA